MPSPLNNLATFVLLPHSTSTRLPIVSEVLKVHIGIRGAFELNVHSTDRHSHMHRPTRVRTAHDTDAHKQTNTQKTDRQRETHRCRQPQIDTGT